MRSRTSCEKPPKRLPLRTTPRGIGAGALNGGTRLRQQQQDGNGSSRTSAASVHAEIASPEGYLADFRQAPCAWLVGGNGSCGHSAANRPSVRA